MPPEFAEKDCDRCSKGKGHMLVCSGGKEEVVCYDCIQKELGGVRYVPAQDPEKVNKCRQCGECTYNDILCKDCDDEFMKWVGVSCKEENGQKHDYKDEGIVERRGTRLRMSVCKDCRHENYVPINW